jgi:hypothetical protein
MTDCRMLRPQEFNITRNGTWKTNAEFEESLRQLCKSVQREKKCSCKNVSRCIMMHWIAEAFSWWSCLPVNNPVDAYSVRRHSIYTWLHRCLRRVHPEHPIRSVGHQHQQISNIQAFRFLIHKWTEMRNGSCLTDRVPKIIPLQFRALMAPSACDWQR